MSDELPRPNTRRFGDYELLEKIGAGGMSTIYKARDTRTQEIVAVKIASRLVINNRQLSRRFELEYAVAHPLDHQNLVKVLDNGKVEKTPYLVMEFVDGPSLSQHLRTVGRLSENDALAIVLPIADALEYLHNKQIIHRDIKPGNIMLTSGGQAKLADLGLIKNLESLSRLTRSNFGLGTMQFASPEQFDNAKDADTRSDIYSLAATLYLMLTGEYPFGKGAMLKVLERKLHNKFDTPISKLPELRSCVDVAIRLGLDKDRERRPASIREFAALLTGEKKVRAAALPGGAPTPTKKGETAGKSAKERRGGTRYAIELEAACRAVVNAGGKRWPAWIIDISTTGFCLHAQRRFETGSLLEVTFTVQTDGSAIHQVARVRWLKATEKNTWLLGCEFVNAIADDDMNAIFADRMDKTRVL
jgi:serine/threonine protein kinase